MAGRIQYQVGFDVDKSGLNQIKTSLQQLSRTKISDIMKINNTDAQGARKILDQVKTQAKQVEQALTKAFNTKLNTANIEAFKTSLASIVPSTQALYQSFSRLGPSGEIAFRKLSTQLLNTNMQLRQSHTLLDKMGTTLANTVKWQLASTAINSISRSIQQAWGFTKSLDASLNDIRIVTGKSADEMEKFAVQANEAAKGLGKTTTDYTKASLIYAQQGLSDSEIAERTDVTLKAANVTGQSTDAVSEELTAVWNGYKVTAEQAQLYVDRLAAVAAKSASNLQELSTGMSKVASAAAAMGVGEDQLAAQLSTIISVTRQAPESVGTALRTVYARISDIKAGIDEDGVTLGRYSGKMADLGINVLDMQGNLRDMGEVMEQIGGKWGDMTREQQVYLAQTMAGQRQYNNLLALFDNFDKYDKMLNVAQNAEGTLQKQQDIYMDSLEAHLNTLKTSSEGLFQNFIDSKSMNGLLDGLSKAVDFMSQFVQSLGGGGAALSSLGSIAFMVFSKQIGESLNTTINNMRMAREQTQFFQQAVVDAQAKVSAGVGDTYTKELLGDQSKFMQLTAGGALNPQAFNNIKNSLLEFEEIANNLTQTQGKIDGITNAFNNASPSVKQMIEDMGGLNEVLNDSAKMGIVQEQLQKIVAAFEPFNEKTKEAFTLYQEFLRSTDGKDLTVDENLDKAAKSAENLRASLVSMVEGLNKTEINGQSLFSMLPQEAKDAITKTNDQLAEIKIDKTNFKESQEAVKNLYTELVSNLNNKKAELELSLKHVDVNSPEWTQYQQQIKAIEAALEEARIKKDNFLQSGINQATVQQFTTITSSITSLAMAVRNLQNLGSIWTNNDLTIGEKLLQTVTNLGMAVGMIIPAYTKLNAIYNAQNVAALQNLSLKTSEVIETTLLDAKIDKQTAKRMKNIMATEMQNSSSKKELKTKMDAIIAAALNSGAIDEETAAKLRQVVATNTATAANETFKKSLMSNPYVLVAMAIIALIAAIGGVVKALEKANEELIKTSNESIDTQNKIQEEIDSYHQLFDALEELNDKVEQQSISRLELKSTIEDLIDQYGLEGDAANKLRSQYDDLGQTLKELRIENAKGGLDSAKTELDSAETLVKAKAKGTASDNGKQVGNQYELQFLSGKRFDENKNQKVSFEPKQLAQALEEIDGAQHLDYLEQDQMIFKIDFDAESIVEFYDTLYGIVLEQGSIGDHLSETQKQSSNYYQQSVRWLNQMEQSVGKYKAALADVEKYRTQLMAFSGDIDFSNINGFDDYINKRDAFIEKIQQDLGKTAQQAANMADVFLRDAYRKSFIQYNEIATLFDKLKKEDASEDKIAKIQKSLSQLDQQHLAEIMNLSPYIKDWKDLDTIIQDIGDTDLSSIDNFLSKDISNAKAGAQEKYQSYQTLYGNISKGENLSSEDYAQLPSQLKELFEETADGTYKLQTSFDSLAISLNEFALKGFTEAKEAAEATLDLIKKIKEEGKDGEGFNLAQLEDETYGANFTRHQKFGVDQEGYRTVTEEKEITSYDQPKIDQRLELLKLAAQQKLYDEEKLKLLEAHSTELETQKQIVQDTQKLISDLNKNSPEELENFINQMKDLAEDAQPIKFIDEDVDPKVLESFTETIQDMAKESKELADTLEKDGKTAEDVAESILRFDDAIQDVTDNYDDWMKALKSDAWQDQVEVIDDLQDAYGDLLDIDGSALSDSFLLDPKNLQLMQQAINGTESAYEELQERAAQDILTQVGIDTSQFYADKNNIQTAMETLTGQQFDDIAVGAELNDANFLAGLEDIINASNMTAQQATDYLASMGVDAEVTQDTSQVRDFHEYVGAEAIVQEPKTVKGTDPLTGKEKTYIFPSVKYRPVPAETEGEKNETSFALKVTSAHKSSGGGLKYKQSSHGGGSGGRSGGGGGSCFVAGTLITVQNYYKNIENIKIGDIVLSYNEKTKMNTYSEVVQTMIHSVNENIYTLYIEDEKIIVTGNHKLFITRNNKQLWLEVSELNTKDYVFFADGTLHKISKIEIEIQSILVYNFEVSNTHNYYVGKNQILAHNKGGGGGGSSGSSKADNSQKEKKDPLKEERDIYHDINIQIEKINRNLSRTQKQQDRLYGKQLLDNLNKQSKILENHKKTLEEKHKIQLQDLADQRKQLQLLGVTFNSYGDIANYMSIILKKQNEVNALIAKENKIIQRYNKQTDSDAKKAISEELDAANKRTQKAKDELKDLQDKIKNYDDLLHKEIPDLLDQIGEDIQEQIEINVQKFRMEVEIRLQMGQAERDWNKFRREVLEHSNILQQAEGKTILKDAKLAAADIKSYFDVYKSQGSIETLTKQLLDTRHEIEQINKMGISVYGDDKAQAMQDLQEDLNELMSQMQDIASLIDDIDEAYLDTIDDIQDQFDEQIESFEFVGELIEHDINLLQLLYGEKNYDAMNKYYTTLEQNNLKQVESLKLQRDFWKKEWQDALRRGDTEAAKTLEQNYKDTINNLNSVIEESAQNLRDKYENAIEGIFYELDKKISNRHGTDYLQIEWDLMNKNEDEYLDTINSAFAIQDTKRKYQKAIDQTQSIKSQRALNKLMEEQLGFLKQKDKLTQYDVDRAEKMLQLEQARIALEDAQAAKTSMRLKRDSQGNYSYEYVVDEAAIADAEAELAKAYNDLYNFDLDHYKSNLDDILAAWKDFQDEYKDIVLDTSLTEEERVEKLALLREQYGKYINDKMAENEVIRNNLTYSAFADRAFIYKEDLDNYLNMTDAEKDKLMSDLVPAWKSGIQEMSDAVSGEGGFIPTTQQSFKKIDEQTRSYQNSLDKLAKTAGVNFKDLKTGVDNLAKSFADATIKSKTLLTQSQKELDAIKKIKTQVANVRKEYEKVYDAAKKALSTTHDFVQNQQKKAANAVQKGTQNLKNSSNQTSSSASTAKNTNKNSSKLSSAQKKAREKYLDYTFSGNWSNRTYYLNGKKVGNYPNEYTQDAKIIQALIDNGIYGKNYSAGDWTAISSESMDEIFKRFGLKTGGYTGDWPGEDGRLAMLHQKELVLNESDTKNLLDTVDILHEVMASLGGTILNKTSSIKNGFLNTVNNTNDNIDQNVHIEASFPNVNSKKEIEEALNELINVAAQKVMRKR